MILPRSVTRGCEGVGSYQATVFCGILTAKSLAQRNRYAIDANQELIGFGACNIAYDLAQAFPVTGADSRTAVNNAMGGKSQMVGVFARGTMLLVLFLLIAPLAFVPLTARAAVIIVTTDFAHCGFAVTNPRNP